MESFDAQKTIMIVDDNLTNLSVLFDTLRSNGFNISVAKSGEKALEQIKTVKPDLILLDVLMSGIDGFETCRRLKNNQTTKDIPVLFMTVLTDKVEKVMGFEVGGADFITKPIECEEVLARVKTHLTIRDQKILLEEKNVELKLLNVSKDRFFSIIAHDLKNSLAVFFSVSRLLSRKRDQEQVHRIANELKNAVENLSKLLENLLNWTHIQMGRAEFKFKYFDPAEAIFESAAVLKHNFFQKNIIVTNEAAAGRSVYADFNSVKTVMRNLLMNAWKFTPKNGKVTISVKVVDSFIEIAVEDTGVGIAAANLPRLFRIEEKYRMNGTEGEAGTGLGLILCKELVEKNGGNISVESVQGKGSCFRFTLPKSADD